MLPDSQKHRHRLHRSQGQGAEAEAWSRWGIIVPGLHLSLASPALTHSPLHASCADHTLATSCPPVPLSFSDETVVRYRLGSSVTKVCCGLGGVGERGVTGCSINLLLALNLTLLQQQLPAVPVAVC